LNLDVVEESAVDLVDGVVVGIVVVGVVVVVDDVVGAVLDSVAD
jgi:hypothetical protein